jgi:hypothetical protein
MTARKMTFLEINLFLKKYPDSRILMYQFRYFLFFRHMASTYHCTGPYDFSGVLLHQVKFLPAVRPIGITSQDFTLLEYTSNMYKFQLSNEKISSSPAHVLMEST